MVNAPTDISFETIPDPEATDAEKLAEQTNICLRASATADAYCNQTLRATINTEDVEGPNFRMTIKPNGVARVMPSEWPVLGITKIQYSYAASFPRSFTTLPTNQYDISQRLSGASGIGPAMGQGVGPSEIEIAPGYVSWDAGRDGYLVRLTYTSGWPHAGITTNASAHATSIVVDDCTGFAVGGLATVATIYDGSATETVSVTAASTTYGPGTLTLSTGLTSAHAAGVPCSCLPGNVQWAVMLFACSEAVTRGSDAISVQAMPGSVESSGNKAAEEFSTDAEILLQPFRRIL